MCPCGSNKQGIYGLIGKLRIVKFTNRGENRIRVSATKYKEELLSEIKGLPAAKIKEVLAFVCFIKAKDAIDPSQS